MAELWAAVALGWRWSFTVSQPGLGIVTRMGMRGLKGGRKGGKGWKIIGKGGGSRREKQMQGGEEGREGVLQGGGGLWGQRVLFLWFLVVCRENNLKAGLAAGFE